MAWVRKKMNYKRSDRMKRRALPRDAVYLPLLAAMILCSVVMPACESAESQPIKIGVQGPMTGQWAYEGVGFRQAVTLLADQVNEAGGVLGGRSIEVIVEDDRGDPDEARRAAERLIEQDVVAVVGGYNSDATEAAAKVYDEAGLLQITPSSTATRLTDKGYRHFFRVCFLDDRQGLFAADFIVKTLGCSRVALVHDGSAYSEGLADWTRRYLEEEGAEVVLYEAISPGQRDFNPLLDKLEGDGSDGTLAEALYFTGYYPEGGLLVKQLKERGLGSTQSPNVQFIAGNATNNPEFVEIAGKEAAAGSIITTEPLPQDMKSGEAQQFIADYQEQYGEPPTSIWTLMAADAFKVIVTAIEETGSTDPDVLAEHIRGMQGLAGVTGTIEGFDEAGDRQGTVHVAYRVEEDGSFVRY
jgi:branched-chain amino acid transport system substrate-binding protein